MDVKSNLSRLFPVFAFCLLGFVACADSAPQPATSEAAAEPPATAALTDLLPNGREPLPGIIAGGQPTREQLDQAATLGLRTVINLRTEGESDIGRQDVEARGMTYVALPITGASGLTAENAAALDAALATAERPVMVHCGSGNRVGALFGLRAHFVEGASGEEALAFGQEAGVTGLEDALRDILATSEDAPPSP